MGNYRCPIVGLGLLAFAGITPAYANGVYDAKSPLAVAYTLTINNMHVGDLVLTVSTIENNISLQAYVESRGVLSLIKPAVYYYDYQGNTFNQISVNKKRYKRYRYTYHQALNTTLSPAVKNLQYDNGKGAELSPIDDTFTIGHTFLSLVGAIMQSTSVPSTYKGCPKPLRDKPIKLFTVKGQSQFIISGDTLPLADLKGQGGNIFSPVYACGWSLQHISGDKAKSDYYQGSQTWFAKFGDELIFPLYHRTKNKDGSVEIELLGVQELGKWLYGEMPILAKGDKYKTLWGRVFDYKNTPYSQ